MALTVIIFFVLLNKSGASHLFHTSNASLYNLIAYNERDRAFLYTYYMIEQKVLFYNLVTNQAAIPMKIVVDDVYRSHFESEMKGSHIQYSYINSDTWNKYMNTHGEYQSEDPSSNFLAYDAILKWIERKKELYPNNFENKPLTLQTYEKRDIPTLRIALERQRKPCIYIIGGENARDWMSIAVIMNYMSSILDNLKTKKVLGNTSTENLKRRKTLLDFNDMYFIPVLNPDGYVFNMDTNYDRYWAKNRRMFFRRMCIGGVDAIGVNVDRNWKVPIAQGTEIECKGIYQGPSSLSESETYSLFQRLSYNAPRMMAVINVKGFGRMITIPYANPTLKTINHDLMMHILSKVTAKLKRLFNETFPYGTTDTYIYNYSGNMPDFVKSKLNIPLVFTVYLQRGDRFLPDADNIQILTKQLKIILEDILMLAKDIYGPLFNSQASNNFLIKNLVFGFISIFLSIVTVR